MMLYNITDYGAVGDGVMLNTHVIRAAIDDAESDGGGTVYVPHGVYRTGTIILKSNITLQLEDNACLLASNDSVDYALPKAENHSNYRYESGESYRQFDVINGHAALIYAYDAENIRITGGRLSADEENFWIKNINTVPFEPALTVLPWYAYKPKALRPRMILLEDCRNVRLQDMTVEKSPVYSAWILGCEHVYIDNIKIFNNCAGPNADGLHFSSCRHVKITNSFFRCGDDCIAIDGNHSAMESSDFIISCCTFDTSVHAFRIYNGLDYAFMSDKTKRGAVRNINISDCIVENACGIFDINAENGELENINVSHITATLDWEGTTFVLSTRNGTIKNVLMDHMLVQGNGCGILYGDDMAGKPTISNVIISNSLFEISPKTKRLCTHVDNFPDWCHLRPNQFIIHNVTDMDFRNIRLKWSKPRYSDSWDEERRNRVLNTIGAETLKMIEPSHFAALEITASEQIHYDPSEFPDFDKDIL